MSIPYFRKIANILKLVSINQTTGGFEAGGVEITGISSVPWAKFIVNSSDPTVGVDPTILCNYLISDRQVYAGGGSPIFQVDPLGGGNKRFLQSPQIYVATVAALNSTYPAATWPGLVAYLGDLGIRVVSNGTRYVPVNGEVLLFQRTYGTIAAPTNTSPAGVGLTTFDFAMSYPVIPANLIAGGDMFTAGFRLMRHGANGVMATKMTLGTAGTNSDAAIWSGNFANTDAAILPGTCEVSVGSLTAFTTNGSGSITGTGSAGIAVDATTNVNFAAIMKLGISGAKNALDSIDLLHYYLKWRAI